MFADLFLPVTHSSLYYMRPTLAIGIGDVVGQEDSQ
ncbi:MAG: hypothetical protein KatS3mg048_3000 [Caldilinea sp.]|nr:MAG: hypothetical protein KatS3mg048_3000 [Caldilinea sp.]